ATDQERRAKVINRMRRRRPADISDEGTRVIPGASRWELDETLHLDVEGLHIPYGGQINNRCHDDKVFSNLWGDIRQPAAAGVRVRRDRSRRADVRGSRRVCWITNIASRWNGIAVTMPRRSRIGRLNCETHLTRLAAEAFDRCDESHDGRVWIKPS